MRGNDDYTTYPTHLGGSCKAIVDSDCLDCPKGKWCNVWKSHFRKTILASAYLYNVA